VTEEVERVGRIQQPAEPQEEEVQREERSLAEASQPEPKEYYKEWN
jgi:hypothetical protein